jgi:Flp pilus assembly protein TadB
MISQAMKQAEAEITKRVKNAKAEAEEAKLAELEKLRKKHDMLSMSLEEDAKRKTKSLQDELDAARQKAAVYTHTHVCVCVCVCTRVHMYIHIHMYIRLYVYRIFWGSYSSSKRQLKIAKRARASR